MLKSSDVLGNPAPLRAEQGGGEPIVSAEKDGSGQECWVRVRKQLRATVGEDIFLSWFASMDFAGIDGDAVRLSVPTRFLKSWILAHYLDRLLSCWQTEQKVIQRVELIVRSGLRTASAKPRPDPLVEPPREARP
jgi:chromosomal replication initiator protein